MQIKDVMSAEVNLVSPGDDLRTVAKMMKDGNFGSLPVGENDRLQGMITDRDIVIRAVAEGKDPAECTVRDVMSEGIDYCFEDDSLEAASQKMADTRHRRLPVLNRQKRLVGIVSLGDLAVGEKSASFTHEALKQIVTH